MKVSLNCINCGSISHLFKDCTKPIVSYGVLAYKKSKAGDLSFLLVQRKDTMGYIDFIRGRYKKNIKKEESYKTLIEEMTKEELIRLGTLDFDTLWDELWVNHNSRAYIMERKSAKSKFEKLDVKAMASQIYYNRWSSQEFCIPKGRKNYNESEIDCAKREFIEETGLNESDFVIKNKNSFISETFYGSNGTPYTHMYLLAKVSKSKEYFFNKEIVAKRGEIKDIKWFTFKNAVNVFRHYDSTKRGVLYRAKNIIHQTRNSCSW